MKNKMYLAKPQPKYLYKIELPPGMGEPLYTNDFNAAIAMAKEYGKGTKVINLEKIR